VEDGQENADQGHSAQAGGRFLPTAFVEHSDAWGQPSNNELDQRKRSRRPAERYDMAWIPPASSAYQLRLRSRQIVRRHQRQSLEGSFPGWLSVEVVAIGFV